MMTNKTMRTMLILLISISFASSCALKDEEKIDALSAQIAGEISDKTLIDMGVPSPAAAKTKPLNLASEQILKLSGRYFYGFDSYYYVYSNWMVINNTNTGLARFDPETKEMMPALAENWIISADKLTWIFTINENIPWVYYDEDSGEVKQALDADGDARFVTAEDVVANSIRVLDTDVDFYATDVFFPILNAEAYVNGEVGVQDVGIKAVDSSTLVIQLEHPAAYLPAIVETACFGAYPAWISEEETEYAPDEFYRYNYGPFVVKAYKESEQLTLIANPFWRAAQGVPEPYLDEILFDLTSTQNIHTNFDEGALDAVQIYINLDRYGDMVEAGTRTKFIRQFPGRCGYYLLVNNGEGDAFADGGIRKAIASSIYRQDIIDQVYFGSASPLMQFAPDLLHPMEKTDPSDGIMQDIQSAKKILASIEDLFTLYSTDSPEQNDITRLLHEQIQETLQQNFSLKEFNFNDFDEGVQSSKDSNLVLLKECASFADAHSLWNLWDNSEMFGNLNEVAGLKDEVTKLMAQAGEEYDPEKRAEIYAQMNDLLIEENGMVIPLIWMNDLWLVRDEIHTGTHPIYPQLETWWIEE